MWPRFSEWPGPARPAVSQSGPARPGPRFFKVARPGPEFLRWPGPARGFSKWPGPARGFSKWPGPEFSRWPGPARPAVSQSGPARPGGGSARAGGPSPTSGRNHSCHNSVLGPEVVQVTLSVVQLSIRRSTMGERCVILWKWTESANVTQFVELMLSKKTVIC